MPGFRIIELLDWLVMELLRAEEQTGCAKAASHLRSIKSILRFKSSFRVMMHCMGVMFEEHQVSALIDDNIDIEFRRA